MNQKQFARHLRKNMTPEESLLWSRIRKKQIHGHRFRRQHPIGPYIVDFICLEENLIIEIDGGQHNQPSQEERYRADYLEKHGYQTLRFWNHEVRNELTAVLDTIARSLAGKTSSPPS